MTQTSLVAFILSSRGIMWKRKHTHTPYISQRLGMHNMLFNACWSITERHCYQWKNCMEESTRLFSGLDNTFVEIVWGFPFSLSYSQVYLVSQKCMLLKIYITTSKLHNNSHISSWCSWDNFMVIWICYL